MPDRRQVYDTPDIKVVHLLPVLAALSDSLAEAARADLRIRLQYNATYKLLLPDWNSPPRQPADTVKALRSKIAVAVHAGAGQSYAPDTRAPRSEDFDPCLDMTAAATLAILDACVGRPAFDRPSSVLAVVEGTSDDVAATLASTVRRGRHAAFAVSGSPQVGTQVAIVRLSDDPEAGSTIAGQLAANGGQPVLLGRVETPGGAIWVDQTQTLPREVRGLVGQVLTGLVAAGLHVSGEDLLIYRPAGAERAVMCRMAPEAPLVTVDEALPDPEPAVAFAVTRLQIEPSEAARKALLDRITDLDFPVGYMVELRPLPDRLRDAADVEQLRERISELQAEIDLIQSLSAPQLRLLRFTDAQLPALVDGLRRMPPDMQRSGALFFASAHAGGRAGPAHFVLYDPALLSFDGRLPEFYWRQETDDRPIAYWLDPHAATAARGARGEPLIFVPDGQRIVPPIDSFGGTLTQTLRLVLGRLFSQTGGLMDTPEEQPIFVFSPPTESGYAMDVELLGRLSFAPLSLSLKWINAHMLVRSPRIAEPERLLRLADDLYEGEVAAVLKDEVAARLEALDAAWTRGTDAVATRIGRLTEALTAEVNETHDHIRLARDYLRMATERIAEIDASVQAARELVTTAENRSDIVRALPQDEGRRRHAFVADLLAEMEVGHATLATAGERINQQRAEIAELVARLRQP